MVDAIPRLEDNRPIAQWSNGIWNTYEALRTQILEILSVIKPDIDIRYKV